MRILQVDDDPLVLRILTETLAHSGFKDCTSAKSVEEAVEVLSSSRRPFDCLLLDLNMGEVSGASLCRWLRKTEAYRTTPIIMVTGARRKLDIDHVFLAGATDYISKPLDLNLLVQKLRKIQRDFAVLVDASVGEKMSFNTPQVLGKIPAEAAISTVENYLLNVGRDEVGVHEAIAIVICKAAQLHFEVGPQRFSDLLRRIGRGIAKYLGPPNCMIAYAGNGALVCVTTSNGNFTSDRTVIARELVERLNLIGKRRYGQGSVRFECRIEGPKKLRAGPSQNAVDALYRLVVDAEFSCSGTVL